MNNTHLQSPVSPQQNVHERHHQQPASSITQPTSHISTFEAPGTTAPVHAVLLDDPPRVVVTIDDDEDDLGTDIRVDEEVKRVKMGNSRLRRRCRRLRIKLASIGEDSRGVLTKCAHDNFEASLVPAFSGQPLISSPLFLSCHVSGICSNFFSGCTSPIC